MNREKLLFLVVLGIAVLWGGSALLSPYSYQKVEDVTKKRIHIPVLSAYADISGDEARLLKLTSGFEKIDSTVPASGRTSLVKYSPYLPVPAIQLDPPEELSTPVVLPPIDPCPGVPWYRMFRSTLRPVTGGPAEEDLGAGGEEEEEEEDTAEEEANAEDILESQRKWEFVPKEWDKLTLENGREEYGTVSLKAAERGQGLTKYHLLLPEHRTLPFYFEKIDPQSGRTIGSATTTLEKLDVTSLAFADNIENRYWSRRVVERVEPGDARALCGLGEWVMDLADQEGYVRKDGLDLAVKTLKEAVAAAPQDLECILALGEAYHRAFNYEDEMVLYENTLKERSAASLHQRLARIYRRLGLPDLEERELTAALALLPLDAETRLARAEARYRQGKISEAEGDFEAVMRPSSGGADVRAQAEEGLARVRIAQGRLDDAVRMLGSRTDAAGLVTLGAALYGQKKFEEAQQNFLAALGADASSTPAKTWLGFAKAQTATDWAGIDEAVKLLDEARRADPLNYFYPPLGQGYAEQRRGLPEKPGGEPRLDQLAKSVDYYETARRALPTDPYIHYILGVSYDRDGRFEDARDSLLKALEYDYRFVDALIWAGTVSMELGDWAKARAFLTRALDLEKRELSSARTDEQKTVARDAVVLLHYRLGRAYLLSSDLQDERLEPARAEFQDLIDLEDRFAPAYIGRAIVEYESGEVAKAKRSLREAKGYSERDSRWYRLSEDMLERITIAESRRLWQDLFARGDSTNVGNAWRSVALAGVGPRLEGGKVLVNGGDQNRDGQIWLFQPNEEWGPQFLQARTKVKVRPRDNVSFDFLIFGTSKTAAESQSEPPVKRAVGIGRNQRNEVEIIEKASSGSGFTRKVAKDPETDEPLTWPEEEVELKIVRSQDAQTMDDYELWIGNRKIATIDGGPGAGQADVFAVGFRWACLDQEPFSTSISMVEVMINRK